MSTLAPASQEILDPFRDGLHVCLTRLVISGNSDTILLPEGLQSTAHVAVVPDSVTDTVPAISSISQAAHPGGVTVTLAAGGTAGASILLLSLHAGNTAGL